MLEELALPGIALVPRFDPVDADTLLVCCERLGVEGLVLKQLAAPYRPWAPFTGVEEVEMRQLALPTRTASASAVGEAPHGRPSG